MRSSSRIAKNQILRREREEKEREIQRIADEIEMKEAIERKRKREEERRLKKEKAVAMALEKKMKQEEAKRLKKAKMQEVEANRSHSMDLGLNSEGGTSSTSNEVNSNMEEKKQPVKKKKPTPKFKIKAKPPREEYDISETSIIISTVTAKQIQKTRSKSNQNKNNTINMNKFHQIIPKAQQKQLVHVPSNNERSLIYQESAKAVAIRESQALPPHGGRPWKCIVSIYDDNGSCGVASSLRGDIVEQKLESKKKNDDSDNQKKKRFKRNASPLFRWYRGKLELACLPHILDEIDEIDTNHGLLKSVKDEYNDALEAMKEEENANDLKSREITLLSTVAWNDECHPIPFVDRKWTSPDHKIFRSRTKTFEHCAMLEDRDKLIDKVIHGIGLRGASIRPVKPTRKQALEAGYFRFLRDGLWVVGQEEEWIAARIEELNYEECQIKTEKAIETVEDNEKHREVVETKDQNELIEKSEDNTEKAEKSIEKSIGHTKTQADETEEGSGVECVETEATNSQALQTGEERMSAASSNQTNDVPEEKNDSNGREVPQDVPANSESKDPPLKTVEDENNAKETEALSEKSVQKRKREYHYEPSLHWRLTPSQIELCTTAIMDHYEKVTYTIKQRALHSELADGFDVFRERGKGRYDMQLPIFDKEQFNFLTDLEKASWMPIVKKILGDDATMVHKGAFLSMPGSSTQVYHQDGPHLTTKYQRPCHAINVFIPLVDLCMQNGPTEFCVGTHILGYDYYSRDMIDVPLARAGCPVIFDYRLGHRGLGNSSQSPRPIVYLTYTSASKEFRDSVNFSQKRYRKLGELIEKPLSRKERALKRARDVD